MMTDYHGFFWAALIYFAIVPGLAGAGIWAAFAWRRRQAPGAVAFAALKAFLLVAGLASLLLVAFLRF
jgi:hypothetical protein